MNVRGEDDAGDARWQPITEETLRNMNFSHPHYVRAAVASLEKDDGIVIGQDRIIGRAA